MRPTSPEVVRKAMRSSLSSRTRNGAPSGSASSSAASAGIQKRRRYSPIGVPGPVRVMASLLAALSMINPSILGLIFYSFKDVVNAQSVSRRCVGDLTGALGNTSQQGAYNPLESPQEPNSTQTEAYMTTETMITEKFLDM